ncbi:MAG: LolA-like putative outer membrane lipoprotein chaperone [Prevotella sp.]
MKKILQTLALLLLAVAASAQTARQVLDKTAVALSNKGGITASFSIKGGVSGTISVKGRKFQASTPQGIVWFDGKTQWTYVEQNGEVNVSNPTAAELQAINPYNFIHLYRNGYKAELKDVGNLYQIHLVATGNGQSIGEMFIRVDKNTYAPTILSMREGKNWTTITVGSFKKANLADSYFTFPSKDYPQAEIIDLR